MATTTLDMQVIRYLNLFEKITQVRTKSCFFYNNVLVYAIPAQLISKAIGENGKNIKQLSNILGKKIKVIPEPNGIMDAEKFILDIINPIEIKELKVEGSDIVITAHRQNKAALIGRNKTRLLELKKILEENFGKGIRIV